MIFENSSIKGIFGPNMSDSPNWWLTANSRSLHMQPLLRTSLQSGIQGFDALQNKCL